MLAALLRWIIRLRASLSTSDVVRWRRSSASALLAEDSIFLMAVRIRDL